MTQSTMTDFLLIKVTGKIILKDLSLTEMPTDTLLSSSKAAGRPKETIQNHSITMDFESEAEISDHEDIKEV